MAICSISLNESLNNIDRIYILQLYAFYMGKSRGTYEKEF